ncbi:hypothetical protein [Bosea sp. 46]|uniref:hypothetical protein n=1 Tax=Bosea sp. 46 TaxID=2768849 RepID=UPI00191ADD74|nr:hypothetical protein [Bosea sp. 46]
MSTNTAPFISIRKLAKSFGAFQALRSIDNAEAGMIKNDLSWMADNRDRVLAEWSKRYESKAAPKN